MIYTLHYNSIIGVILLASKQDSLIGLWTGSQRGLIEAEEAIEATTAPLTRAANWLDDYFCGNMPSINELSLMPHGSEFRMTVWELLCTIPYGKTVTYGELAKKVAALHGKERISAQAIGNAVGHNPISIIIPCHRVIGANGDLTGYAGGIDIKRKLLAHEGIDADKLL